MAVIPEYVFDESLPPLDQEIHILTFFKDNMPILNAKKIKKLALKLNPQLPFFIQKSLIENLLFSANPVRFLERCFAEMFDYPKIIANFIAEGNHGMIMYKNELHGFDLKTNPKWLTPKDGPWTKENEVEIMEEAIDAWMEKMRLRRFVGRVLLFRDFGFTGIPIERHWEMKQVDWDACQLKWAEEDRIKTTNELEQYMAMVEDK